MSDHGANPIFFNKKKIKIGRSEHSLAPHPRNIRQHIIFALAPLSPTILSSLKADVICGSPLN